MQPSKYLLGNLKLLLGLKCLTKIEYFCFGGKFLIRFWETERNSRPQSHIGSSTDDDTCGVVSGITDVIGGVTHGPMDNGKEGGSGGDA